MGGRPRVYCGDVCKRTAEKRVRQHARLAKWARNFLTLPAASANLLRVSLGEAAFERRRAAATSFLAAECPDDDTHDPTTSIKVL
jgi:hypothetical protein